VPSPSNFVFVFGIPRSPSSFKVMGLISRSQQRRSGRSQVFAHLGHSLIIIGSTFDFEKQSFICILENYKFRKCVGLDVIKGPNVSRCCGVTTFV